MKITSPVFEPGQAIPKKYTCDGEDVNPPLELVDVPEEAQSLALIVDDPDAEAVAGHVWDHWVLLNLDPKTTKIEEGSVPEGAIQGQTSFSDRSGYGGPCPPDREHRYFFRLYALSNKPEFSQATDKQEFLQAVEGEVLDQAELVGTYQR